MRVIRNNNARICRIFLLPKIGDKDVEMSVCARKKGTGRRPETEYRSVSHKERREIESKTEYKYLHYFHVRVCGTDQKEANYVIVCITIFKWLNGFKLML